MADRQTTDCILRMQDNCNTDNTIVTRNVSESNVGVSDTTNTCITSSTSENNVGVPDNTNTCITRSISEINIGKPDINVCLTNCTPVCYIRIPDHTDTTNERGSVWSFFERMSLDHNRSWYPTLDIYNRVFVKIWTFLSLLMNFIPFSLPKKTIDKKKIYTQNKMESFVHNLLNLGCHQKFKVPKNNIKGCGGFYEDMSSTKANDCDYGIELDIPPHYIEFRHVCDVPCEDPNRIKRKRYFEASFTKDAKEDSEFVEKWACRRQRCHHDTNTIDCEYTFNPKIIQSQFEESITHGLQMLKTKQDFAYGSIHKRGPAVSIAFTFKKNKKYCLNSQFTVDLTIQLRPGKSWRNCPKTCLTLIDNQYEPTMVPSADYWRISFAEYETDIIRNLDVHAKKIYFEAKLYRDKYVPSLPTYPLKQSIFQKQAEIKTEGLWVIDGVQTLLEYIGGQVNANKFTNYFYPDDPIMDKQDKAFPLVVNLQQKLNREALYNKGIFIASWSLFALCFIPLGYGTVKLGFQIQVVKYLWTIDSQETIDTFDINSLYLFKPHIYIVISVLNVFVIGSLQIYLQGFESVTSVVTLTILSASCVLYTPTNNNIVVVWLTVFFLLLLIFVYMTIMSIMSITSIIGDFKCKNKSDYVIMSYILFVPIILVFIGLILRPFLDNVFIFIVTAICLVYLTLIASYITIIAVLIETSLLLIVVGLMLLILLSKLCPCYKELFITLLKCTKLCQQNRIVLIIGSVLLGLVLGYIIAHVYALSMLMMFHVLQTLA